MISKTFPKQQVLMVCPNSKGINALPLPPLGMLWIASYLRENGVTVDAIDCSITKSTRTLEEKIDWADVVGISCTSSHQYESAKDIGKLCRAKNKVSILGGIHATVLPDESSEHFTVIVRGEGEQTMLELLKNNIDKLDKVDGITWRHMSKVYSTPDRKFIKDIDKLPLPARDLIPPDKYPYRELSRFDGRYTSILGGRGCPNKCLSGDTRINTVEGDIPVKDLVKKKKIGVYTYDRKTKEVFITDAINIRKIQTNAELVRVHFDDGTHIDCTPDHKFLTFKNGNQFVKTREKIKEAKDLEHKESVRAIKFGQHNYCLVSWGRRKSKLRHRMVIEYFLGRKLDGKEEVHHKDNNRFNDSKENLLLCKNHKEHYKNHPEISERMKKDNPQKYWTDESYKKQKQKLTGLKRSLKSKLNYRKSKLGENNPNYKHGMDTLINSNRKSRIEEINHKVIRIEKLKERQDVYCMEVPKTNWFYANNVLVHNCIFCASPVMWKYARLRSAEKIFEEMVEIYEKWNIKNIHFHDDTFTLDRKRVIKLCSMLIESDVDFRWSCITRPDKVDTEILEFMKKGGCVQIEMGAESGSDKLLKVANKGYTTKEVKEAFKLANDAGLTTYGYFIIGLPGENIVTWLKTIFFARKLNLDSCVFTVLSPFPGTTAYEEGMVSILKKDCWLYKEPVIRVGIYGPKMLKFMRKVADVIVNGFGYHGAYTKEEKF